MSQAVYNELVPINFFMVEIIFLEAGVVVDRSTLLDKCSSTIRGELWYIKLKITFKFFLVKLRIVLVFS